VVVVASADILVGTHPYLKKRFLIVSEAGALLGEGLALLLQYMIFNLDNLWALVTNLGNPLEGI
jgi:hypothetical protein